VGLALRANPRAPVALDHNEFNKTAPVNAERYCVKSCDKSQRRSPRIDHHDGIRLSPAWTNRPAREL